MGTESTSHTRQLLTFQLEGDVFALPIARVREVVEFSQVTRVPKARPYVLGLLNLRGSIIPVVDLRAKLGMKAAKPTVDTCVIVTEIISAEERLVVGALADSVREVTELAVDPNEEVPSYGLDVPTVFLDGIARQKERLVLVLEPNLLFRDKALSGEDEHAAA